MNNEDILKHNNGRKFDIVLMNPPYSGSLHLKFLDKVIEIADNVVSVQPATFLINTRNFGKAISEYVPLKNKIEGHVKSCEIDNMNNEFKIGNKMLLTIIHIDHKHNYDKIDYTCCGENKEVNSIYDCNLVGNINIIKSILKKISAIEIGKQTLELGAGKNNISDKIDYTVGVKLNKLEGEKVRRGDVLATLYVNNKIPTINIDSIFTII